MQLALWDAPTTLDGVTCEEVRWADDDTDPAGLERLALVILGDHSTHAVKGDTEKMVRRCISTSVDLERGCVVAAYELVCPLAEFYGGRHTVVDDEID